MRPLPSRLRGSITTCMVAATIVGCGGSVQTEDLAETNPDAHPSSASSSASTTRTPFVRSTAITTDTSTVIVTETACSAAQSETTNQCGAGPGGCTRVPTSTTSSTVDVSTTSEPTTSATTDETSTTTSSGKGDGCHEIPPDAGFDVTPPPAGLAGFAFVVNGVVQTPLSCSQYKWQFPFASGQQLQPPSPPPPPLAGVCSAIIINTGTLPMPYLAQAWWNAGGNVPGGATGASLQVAGVLDPGAQVDITSVYLEGYVALLGSAEPFSASDAGYAADEGEIPWPAGVAGGGGSSTMYVAQVYVPYGPPSRCSADEVATW